MQKSRKRLKSDVLECDGSESFANAAGQARRRASSVFRSLLAPGRDSGAFTDVHTQVFGNSEITPEEEALMHEILVQRRRSSVLPLPVDKRNSRLDVFTEDEELFMREIIAARRQSTLDNAPFNLELESGGGQLGSDTKTLWSADEELLCQRILESRRRSSIQAGPHSPAKKLPNSASWLTRQFGSSRKQLAASGKRSSIKVDDLLQATIALNSNSSGALQLKSSGGELHVGFEGDSKPLVTEPGFLDARLTAVSEVEPASDTHSSESKPIFPDPATVQVRLSLAQRTDSTIRVNLRKGLEVAEGVPITNKATLKMPRYIRSSAGRRISQDCALQVNDPAPPGNTSRAEYQWSAEEEKLMQDIVEARRRSSVNSAAIFQQMTPSTPHSAELAQPSYAAAPATLKASYSSAVGESAAQPVMLEEIRTSASLAAAVSEVPKVPDRLQPSAAALFRKALPVLAAQKLAASVVEDQRSKPASALTRSRAGQPVRAWHT